MLRITTLAAVLAMAQAASAFAADQPENLFISPAGQPFTAPASKPYPIVDWFNAADKNKDGKLSKDEHRADAEIFFADLDRNKDGFIAGIEVTIYERYYVPEILSLGAAQTGLIRVNMQIDDSLPGDDSGGNKKQRQRLNSTQGAVFFSLFREPQPVRAADRNLDYKVSLQEFRDHADRHFDALDTDGDGFLTLATLPQTPAERQAKGRRQ